MHIDKKSPIPAYFQLKTILLEKIKSGVYEAGDIIPSERELSENLGISRMTARQAISQLAAEGFLLREKGKGTFVNKAKFEQRNIMSFSETVKKKGMIPLTKILEFEKMTECFDIKDKLELSSDAIVYRIKRLRMANETPIAIEEVYIPVQLCPNIEKHDLTESLYELIKKYYSIDINYIDNNIEAVKTNKEQKELLEVAAGIPVLKITGISYTQEGKKLFYETAHYRADKYNYNVRIYMNKE